MFTVLGLSSSAASATVVLDARGGEVVNDLRQISLAIHNYADTHNRLPGNITDDAGTPLLSWRVALLPFLEQTALYEQFDLSAPWNVAPNLDLLQRMPEIFRGPFDAPDSGHTHYARGAGADTLLDGSVIRLSDIRDGTSNTLLVGEVEGSDIPWTAPLDIAIDPCPWLPALGDPGFFSSRIADEVPFALADGRVGFLDRATACETLYSLFIRNDDGPQAFTPLDYVVLDRDGDGVLDSADQCPDSLDAGKTLSIGGHDSGVANLTLENGCTLSDLIQKIAAASKNHGQFVVGVTHLTNLLRKAGVLSGGQAGAIQRAAAESSLP